MLKVANGKFYNVLTANFKFIINSLYSFDGKSNLVKNELGSFCMISSWRQYNWFLFSLNYIFKTLLTKRFQ